ncbi:hypothetical protein SAMN05421757_11244 [Tropicimonas sediminicola]|uniref:Acyltransferase family protein n=1 Tax=Tropicimonas sediminicola TaxID=1031541 RepID=A0A239M3N7_9RHOB|nr:hypothetical protein SAMN05421757_11244 [Tropicimonas sediminicola]
MRVLALIVLFGGLGASKAARLNISDLELGLIVATCLPALAHMPGHGRWYQCIARSSSEISYTLYLTHFPLLSLLAFSTLAPTRLAPNIVGYGVMLGFVTLALLWAVLLYQLFESRTDRLYRAVSRLL